MTQFKIVIPARHDSSRLPGKLLMPLAGKPVIVHVCEQALAADAEEVIVATDHEQIAEVVSATGVRAMLTDPGHESGTERLFEVAARCGWDEDVIVVNWQGDEPLLTPALVNHLAHSLESHPAAAVATLAAPLAEDEIFNPHAVKVVLNQDGYAMYFSRAPIPWDRDGFARQPIDIHLQHYLRHIGVYAYRAGVLKRYVNWPKAPIEEIEALEQLRLLWHGEQIYVVTVAQAPEAGVDTLEDLERVERCLASSEPD
ncbi:MAG: 3-deoxy-manno-octulosonate cytidylyltransferase [Methylothermaceae bacteria B42]|nr:MAG: 3-deoxy-manno-octulosonate cytidylyltransferase [Methylothermaceae bacteria B42]